uniref:Putative secreted protein n=1 Tax=Anopheles darlingi TaxID=43151 RepID=A0A2M4DE39_ANODA
MSSMLKSSADCFSVVPLSLPPSVSATAAVPAVLTSVPVSPPPPPPTPLALLFLEPSPGVRSRSLPR